MIMISSYQFHIGCQPVMTCLEDVRGIKRTYQEKLAASRRLQQ